MNKQLLKTNRYFLIFINVCLTVLILLLIFVNYSNASDNLIVRDIDDVNKINTSSFSIKAHGNTSKSFSEIIQYVKKTNQNRRLRSNADQLINYYDNIENYIMDNMLYYLSQNLNDDGSFGHFNQYEITAQIILILSSFRRIESSQFSEMLNYIQTTEPQNNREKAIKSLLLPKFGESPQFLLNDLISQQNNENGGFSIIETYDCDVLTTLEVAYALWENNYSIDNALPKALYYVFDQIQTDGKMFFTTGSQPSFYLINKTLEYLKPFENLSLGTGENNTTIQSKIDVLLNFLRNQYEEETGGLSSSKDLIDILMTIHSFQLYDTDYEKQQSLLNIALQFNPYAASSFYEIIAALKVFPKPDLKILSIVNNGDLINNEHIEFKVDVINNGYASANSMVLYSFVDDYKLINPIDLKPLGLFLDPQDNAILTINFDAASDRFLGEMNIKFYIEEENETNTENNWLSKSFNFSGALDNSPALPLYFIAYNTVFDNLPAINAFWMNRNDSNRIDYILFYRLLGNDVWSNLILDNNNTNNIVLRGFGEGATYEISMGVLASNMMASLHPDIVRIKMSSTPSLYSGNISGFVTIDNMPKSGINVFTHWISSSISNESGDFFFNNVPNGSILIYANENYCEQIFSKVLLSSETSEENIRVFSHLKQDDLSPQANSLELLPNTTDFITNSDFVELIANGVDNTMLKEADFYYWDPKGQYWTYIGTSQIINSETRFEWFIPERLQGKGYKIKSIFWDYQNNVSDPIEYGSFDIKPYPSSTVDAPDDPQLDRTIESWNTNEMNKMTVLKFRISDQGNDGLPTIIDKLCVGISGSAGNAFHDIAWAEVVNSYKQKVEATLVTDNSIIFGFESNDDEIAQFDLITNGSFKEYTLSIYFNSNLLAINESTYIFDIDETNVFTDLGETSLMKDNTGSIIPVIGTVFIPQLSITITPDSQWIIGPKPLNSVVESDVFYIENNGNISETISIYGSNSANGWHLTETTGKNLFKLLIDVNNLGDYEFMVSTNFQTILPVLKENRHESLRFKYYSPSMDTIGAGVPQDFQIILKASMCLP